MTPLDMRIALLPAKAKMVNCSVLDLLEQNFGKNPKRPVRMVEKVGNDDLRHLYIEGGKFDVGLRFKKLDGQFRSYQHSSVLQDSLRKDRIFPCMAKDTAHVIVGYQQTSGLEPSIESIWITMEGLSCVEWKHCIWNASRGIEPIQETQTDFLPQEPTIKPKEQKRKKAEGEDR